MLSSSSLGGGEPPLAISSSRVLLSCVLPFSRHSSAHSGSVTSSLFPQVGALVAKEPHCGDAEEDVRQSVRPAGSITVDDDVNAGTL